MSGPPNNAANLCVHCGHAQEAGAKFCGGCGVSRFDRQLNAQNNQLHAEQNGLPASASNIQYAQNTVLAAVNTTRPRQPFPVSAQQLPASTQPLDRTAPRPVQPSPVKNAQPLSAPAPFMAATKAAVYPEVLTPSAIPAATARAQSIVVPPHLVHASTVPTSTPTPAAKAVPSFVQVHAANPAGINKELQAEAAKLIVLLARERVCLLFHIGLFVCLNFTGFALAQKCYTEFVGDALSKIIIAITPFIFINCVALICIIPIRGTRKEIRRLKERIGYVRFKLEFGHLI